MDCIIYVFSYEELKFMQNKLKFTVQILKTITTH